MEFSSKMHKTVKLLKIPPKMLIKALGSLCGMLCSSEAPQRYQYDNLAFMTFLVTVDSSNYGWERSLNKLLRNCQGVRFKMDQDGKVEVNAIGNPNKVLRKMGRSRRIKLEWYQFGQCSTNLFLPETKKESAGDNMPTNGYPPFPLPYGGGYGYPSAPSLPPPESCLFRQLPYY